MPSLTEIGAYGDWITPTLAWLDGLIFGPTYKFMILIHPHLTAAQMKAGLRKYKVRTRNSMVVGDTILIWVSMKQARWAYVVLTKLIKVSVLNPPPEERRVPRQKQKAASRFYQCSHCGSTYRNWRKKCRNCGAPIGRG